MAKQCKPDGFGKSDDGDILGPPPRSLEVPGTKESLLAMLQELEIDLQLRADLYWTHPGYHSDEWYSHKRGSIKDCLSDVDFSLLDHIPIKLEWEKLKQGKSVETAHWFVELKRKGFLTPKPKIGALDLEGKQSQPLIYNSPSFDQWEGHAFRSAQEVRIAKALDERGVLFFPNAGCRITEGEIRKTREADFLVIIEGRIGILECDGKAYHQTAAEDHQRDRHFQRQGIRFIQRYSYEECLQEYQVVDDFLELMRKFFNL